MSRRPILIVGFGSVGRRHYRNLQALGKSDFIFCRSGHSSIDSSEISDYPVFEKLSDALERDPVATIICNPTSHHMSTALAAASAGSHIFLEKPVSHSLEGTADLLKLVAERNLTAMVGCQHRFHPLLAGLRNRISEGQLGQIVDCRAEYGEYLPGWHSWEDYRLSYSAREDLGGGVVLTLIHPLDYLYWIFGSVEVVTATIKKIPELETKTADDLAEIHLTFSSGVSTDVHLDYIQQPPVHTLAVTGTKGNAALDFLGGTLTLEIDGLAPHTEHVRQDFTRNSMFVEEMRHFLSCLETGDDVLIPLQDGIEVLKIALSAKAYGTRN